MSPGIGLTRLSVDVILYSHYRCKLAVTDAIYRFKGMDEGGLYYVEGWGIASPLSLHYRHSVCKYCQILNVFSLYSRPTWYRVLDEHITVGLHDPQLSKSNLDILQCKVN